MGRSGFVAVLSDRATHHSGNVRMDWKTFPPLSCLQELDLHSKDVTSGLEVQLDDSFATAMPLLRMFHMTAQRCDQRNVALETTAKVVMPHLVKLTISWFEMVHLDLRFMSALKSLDLYDCTVSTVSAACTTMDLTLRTKREGTVLVTPNLRSLAIHGGGKLDGSRCRHALSIVCRVGSIDGGVSEDVLLLITYALICPAYSKYKLGHHA